MKALASVRELESAEFRSFMNLLNDLARAHDLRVHTDWSKVWEYPWAWRALGGQDWPRLKVMDVGSEKSPVPWLLGCLGADVTLVEADRQWKPLWAKVREALGCQVRWVFSDDETLPLPDESYDIVTSFSTIEHQRDKAKALAEVRRVLRPGGLFVASFDICEPDRGMSFPEWNGRALTMAEFDALLWNAEGWRPLRPADEWNVEDIPAFMDWHLRSAAHHRYVVGAAVLRKAEPSTSQRSVVPALQICNGLGAGNIGDEFMARAFWDRLPPRFRLTVEVFPEHAQEREPYPQAHRYLKPDADAAFDGAVGEAAVALLVGDTPVMEAWGLDWPMRFLSRKLEACHRRGLPVEAVGVGVDRLESDEARELFRRNFLPIRSWTVRSAACRAALLDLGVAEERVLVGADWAWLYRQRRDLSAWADGLWRELGVDPSRPLLVANVVNEIWSGDAGGKQAMATALDTLAADRGLQVAFFCNEVRAGEYFDLAAAKEIQALMRRPAVLVPNLYYSPDEVLGLLSRATVTLSERYHFTVETVLAGSVPVNVIRGQKMEALVEDIGLPAACRKDRIEAEAVIAGVRAAVEGGDALRQRLAAAKRHLAIRAEANLSFLTLPR